MPLETENALLITKTKATEFAIFTGELISYVSSFKLTEAWEIRKQVLFLSGQQRFWAYFQILFDPILHPTNSSSHYVSGVSFASLMKIYY